MGRMPERRLMSSARPGERAFSAFAVEHERKAEKLRLTPRTPWSRKVFDGRAERVVNESVGVVARIAAHEIERVTTDRG